MNDYELNEEEKLILSILTSKRRSMTAKQVTDELKKQGIVLSRPTIAKYMRNLKDKGWIKER